MKSKIIIAVALLVAITAFARIIVPFESWSTVESESSNIIIARCGNPTPPVPGVLVMNATKSDSNITVISMLKGANNPSLSRLLTDHELEQGENYLVFGYYDSGIYQAYEEYRVIPLGRNFHTNSIAGKSLDEQIQILFQRRLDNLNRQMTSEQQEKERLEQALMK